MRYLMVQLFTSDAVYHEIGECTYFIEHDRGNWTEDDLDHYTGPKPVILKYVPAVQGGKSAHYVDKNATHFASFSGTFIYTSDSRFPFDTAVKLFI